ncbi:MAG: GAF domain-containing protein [Actinomycetota bacterium]|nr:GAF domain-containing protein [Actinomycetota bacterium]
MSRRALSSPEFTLADEGVRLVGRILEAEFASVLELRPDLNAFLVRASVGWSEKVKGATGLTTGPDTHAGAAVIADRPVVIEDSRTDIRFSASRPLHEEGVVSGASDHPRPRRPLWSDERAHNPPPLIRRARYGAHRPHRGVDPAGSLPAGSAVARVLQRRGPSHGVGERLGTTVRP